MKRKEKSNVKVNSVNVLGAIGYLLCSLQWFWATMLYFSVIQSIPLMPTEADKPVEQFHVPALTLPGPVESAIVGIVVIAMIIITIYVLAKAPVSIAKTGNIIVYKAAETVTPVVAKVQHKKDTKTFRAKITPRLVLAVKGLLVITPLGLTVASGLLQTQPIDYYIAVIIGCGLAFFGMILFAAQYGAASILRVKLADLW